MASILDGLAAGWQYMSGWELTAVLLALAYLLLVMRQNIWCWPAAFFSTMIYTVLFWDVALLMESALNGYYLLMAVYGWYCWTHGNTNDRLARNDHLPPLAISSWSLERHLVCIALLALLSGAVGYVMATYTHADFAYLDATTTVFSVFTTYLVAKKVLENWLYWVVIDVVSIYLYIHKGFYLTVVLFIAYTVLAIVGYLQWRKSVLQRPLVTA